MKGSNGSSASTPSAPLPPTSRRASNPPSPRAEIAVGGFSLAGRSDLPDPATNAYRQDLADIALAGRVIASHYAEPLRRTLAVAAPFFADRDDPSEPIALLDAGDEIDMLDCSRGWAWGYAGPDRKVGYVRFEALKL